ncbi:hypothetical protein D3C85_1423010 [compost metagenome]
MAHAKEIARMFGNTHRQQAEYFRVLKEIIVKELILVSLYRKMVEFGLGQNIINAQQSMDKPVEFWDV